MNNLIKTESAIFVSLMCFLLTKDIHSELILSSLQLVLCLAAAVKRLLVDHHSLFIYLLYLYIFWSFGIIGLILSQFGNRIPRKPVLGGVGSVASLHYCTCTDFFPLHRTFHY